MTARKELVDALRERYRSEAFGDRRPAACAGRSDARIAWLTRKTMAR